MRKALILGAGGFLGSHLSRHLIGRGWEVTGVVRDGSDPLVATRLESVIPHLCLVEGDAADPFLLGPLLKGMDAVFPFAGRSGAASSMDEPLDDLAANGHAQLALLEALRRNNPDARTVFPGSRLQYGRCDRLPVGEDQPQQPSSVYGVHKMLGEQYHRLYWSAYGIPTTSLRISNPYGPHQDRPDGRFGVVGTFFARAARGEEILIYGGGQQIRDYLYVGDLVSLFEVAATHPAAVGEVFNASGPEPVSLREMAEAVIATVGGGRIVTAEWPSDAAAVETGDYFGDTSRAGRLLGWSPQTGLCEGLASSWASLSPTLAAAG